MKSSAPFLRCRAVSNRLFALLLLLSAAACGPSEEPLVCSKTERVSGGKCVCQSNYIKTESGACELNPKGLPGISSNVADAAGDTGNGIGLALDGTNLPHLSYYEANNGDLRYATVMPETGKWKVETVERDADAGVDSSLGLYDPQGTPRPVIAYYDVSHKALKGAFRAKSGWVKKFLDPRQQNDSLDRGRHTSIRVENANDKHIAHIAYIDNLSKDLYYVRWNLDKLDDVAQPRLVDSGFSQIDGQQYGSGILDDATGIAFDSNGAPIIAYRDSKTADLKVAFYEADKDRWNTTFVDNDPISDTNLEDLGQFLSLAVDSVDNVHVAYYDRTNLALKYAQFDGSDWAIETVDRGNVGAYASLALRAEDRSPFIAYFDATQGAVKIAHKKRDGTWQVESVASQGLPGFYVQIAVTTTGWPAIAYREFFTHSTLFEYVFKPFP
jgi:hypothetical protein